MSFHSLASLLSSEAEDDDDGRNNNRLLRDTSIARTKVRAFLAKELERRLIDDTSSRRSTVSYSSRDYGSTTCTSTATHTADRWRRAPPPPSRSSDPPMISSAHASTHDPDESPSVLLNYNDDDAVAVASPSSPTSSPVIVAEEDATAASKACQGETTRRADADESTYAVPSGEEEEEDAAVPVENDGATNDDHSHRRSKLADLRITIMSTILSPLLDRLLSRPSLSDRLFARYPPLLLLSQHARIAAPAFGGAYLLLVSLLWLPLWMLGRIVTEAGVYLLLLTGAAHGGRCLLRLLAFPGTNVRVYGEIENEFAKYSWGMLEGAAGSLEDFAKSLRGGDDNDGWDVADVPGTFRRMDAFRRRVLGAYLEVLHCLLEEDGRGYDPYSSIPSLDGNTAGNNDGDGSSSGNNGFYNRLGICDNIIGACGDTCKRNLCCDKRSSSDDVEGGIHLDVHRSAAASTAHSIMPPPSNATTTTTTTTTRYGNNPLMGDIGNMGNLTAQARGDGRELYDLLTSTLRDLSTLESSAGNVLRNITDDGGRWKDSGAVVSGEVAEDATRLLVRAGELRELASRMRLPSAHAENGDAENGEGEEGVNAESVRQRLEGQGTVPSSSTMGMVKSAVQAFAAMIDPPPHRSVFGLDVVRGCFLARYAGARQFWVPRSREGGDGRLDVIHVPSSSAMHKFEDNGTMEDPSIESLLPLSPRKGRAGVASTGNVDGGVRGNARRKAVLYCNPNAGLMEVATGMGLTGGNVDGDDDDEEKEPTCWTEYYIEHGYDVYLFNYAGYGRSYGGSRRNDPTAAKFDHAPLGALRRVLYSTFLAFKPSSESLRADASAVARHLVDTVGVDELIIHGESIGGMAAAGAARALTDMTASSSSKSPTAHIVLVCDRTFCNLEAVAQRLVGQWTGTAIRVLTPTWSTDVARDFLAAGCSKIVAQDCADEIIHDASSLKSGLALSGELTKGQTNNLGWMTNAPLEHRLADLDDVGLSNSRLGGSCQSVKSPPTWPADKHVSWSEAHHFSACVRRIGKMATVARKRIHEENKRAVGDLGGGQSDVDDAEEGIEVSLLSSTQSSTSDALNKGNDNARRGSNDGTALVKLWNKLLLADGLCGHHLGHAVKEGSDCTIAWLCCVVVFGSQVLAERAERRWDGQQQSSEGSSAAGLGGGDNDERLFSPEDFDSRPRRQGHQWDEDDLAKHALPIPEVLSSLKKMMAQTAIISVEVELHFVIGMLEYIVSRLCSEENIVLSLSRRNGRKDKRGVISTGCFLNLHCGHNNQYSPEERVKLISLIRRSCCDPA